MAIFHFHAKVVKRSADESSLAAAAYASGSKLKDHGKNQTFNYQRKKGVVHSEILAPLGAPEWVHDREALWNRVERAEKRRDAQVARSIVVALPKEITFFQQKTLLINFIQANFIDHGMIVDFSIHHDDQKNPHAHLLLTMRSFVDGEFGSKFRQWNDSKILLLWRKAWADAVNAFIVPLEFQAIDHRSHEERGLRQKPTIHLGRKNHYANKFRKVELGRSQANRQVKRTNLNPQQTNGMLLANRGYFKSREDHSSVKQDLDHEPTIKPTS